TYTRVTHSFPTRRSVDLLPRPSSNSTCSSSRSSARTSPSTALTATCRTSTASTPSSRPVSLPSPVPVTTGSDRPSTSGAVSRTTGPRDGTGWRRAAPATAGSTRVGRRTARSSPGTGSTSRAGSPMTRRGRRHWMPVAAPSSCAAGSGGGGGALLGPALCGLLLRDRLRGDLAGAVGAPTGLLVDLAVAVGALASGGLLGLDHPLQQLGHRKDHEEVQDRRGDQ